MKENDTENKKLLGGTPGQLVLQAFMHGRFASELATATNIYAITNHFRKLEKKNEKVIPAPTINKNVVLDNKDVCLLSSAGIVLFMVATLATGLTKYRSIRKLSTFSGFL